MDDDYESDNNKSVLSPKLKDPPIIIDGEV
jgi:hypothetical protein